MSKNSEFIEYIKETLEPFGNISTRSMFGGCGIYKNGLIFALIADNELYFKSDHNTATFFQTYGSEPFTYDNGKKLVQMSYWKVTPEVLENQEILQIWVDKAYAVSIEAKKTKS